MTGSSNGVECRVDEIVSELKGYIAAGFTSVDKVVSLLQKGPIMSEPGNAKIDIAEEQPSVAEVNVSNCPTSTFVYQTCFYHHSEYPFLLRDFEKLDYEKLSQQDGLIDNWKCRSVIQCVDALNHAKDTKLTFKRFLWIDGSNLLSWKFVRKELVLMSMVISY